MHDVRATWEVTYPGPDFLVISDMAEVIGSMSITNDAEAVVRSLIIDGSLDGHLNLYYYDTDGNLDELVYRDGKFICFRVLSAAHRLSLEGVIERAGVTG